MPRSKSSPLTVSRATVYLEVKYTEGLYGPAATTRPRYGEVSRELGLFINPDSSVLRTRAIEQFWRLHMLARLAVRHGVTPRAVFVTISPALNRRVAAALTLFNAELAAPVAANDAQVGFIPLTLEAVVAALASAGDEVSATALTDRYLDFQPVLDLVLSQDLSPPRDPPTAPFIALPAPASSDEQAPTPGRDTAIPAIITLAHPAASARRRTRVKSPPAVSAPSSGSRTFPKRTARARAAS